MSESITPSYGRQHDVPEHFSQHATLAFPQPNCAMHLSKCQRSRSQRAFKKPFMSHVPREKSQVKILRGEIPFRTVTKQGDKEKAGENIRTTFSGQDIGCCYGNLSHTTTSSFQSKHRLMSEKNIERHYVLRSAVLCKVVTLCSGAPQKKSNFKIFSVKHTCAALNKVFFLCIQIKA